MGNSLGTERIGKCYVTDLPCLQVELILFSLNYVAYDCFLSGGLSWIFILIRLDFLL